jgi:hypothetical protein
VGPHKHEYLHTLVGGSNANVPIVMMPGYGAGSGFWFRWARSSLPAFCWWLLVHAAAHVLLCWVCSGRRAELGRVYACLLQEL